MRSEHRRMMGTIIPRMKKAARDFSVKLDTSPGHIGAAFSAMAIVVNAQIAGTQNASVATLKRGLELLFVFLSVPKSRTRHQGTIPSGFYVVRIKADPKSRNGRAVLLNKSRMEIASFPVEVAAADGGKHSVSGSFGWCHVSFDVRVRAVLITVTARWCK